MCLDSILIWYQTFHLFSFPLPCSEQVGSRAVCEGRTAATGEGDWRLRRSCTAFKQPGKYRSMGSFWRLSALQVTSSLLVWQICRAKYCFYVHYLIMIILKVWEIKRYFRNSLPLSGEHPYQPPPALPFCRSHHGVLEAIVNYRHISLFY